MKLKYTKNDVAVSQYKNGLQVWEGIHEIYSITYVNRKLILRVDALQCLKNVFTPEVAAEYHRMIFYTLCKAYDVDTMCKVLQALDQEDRLFHDFLLKSLIDKCAGVQSIGDFICDYLSSKMQDVYSALHDYFKGTSRFLIAMSEGYIYFATDEDDCEFDFPYDVDVEVVGHDKGRTITIKQPNV